MKAIVFYEFGPPEVMRYEDVPDPQPRFGEVRIRVGAATVNRILDVAVRNGSEPQRGALLPCIPGVDCAGTIDAVGGGITRWKVGDRVAATGTMPLDPCPDDDSPYNGPEGMMGIKRPGGFAELVVVPARCVSAIPGHLDFATAAVALRHVPMAWNLLHNVAKLQRDEWVLVMGASGNLGSIGIQIAKHVIGAHVIGAAGSAERAEVGLNLGADAVVNYGMGDIYADVMRLTGGRGIDVIYDNVGNPRVFPGAFATLRTGGRLVTAGAHAGPEVTLNLAHLYRHRISIHGMSGRGPEDEIRSLEFVADGKIDVRIDRILPLSQAVYAHRLMEADSTVGKIVLDPTLG